MLPAITNGDPLESHPRQYESNGRNGHSSIYNAPIQEPQTATASRLPLLSVDRALRFSPLSSIVPYSPDIVPIPSASISGATSLFLTPSDRKHARRPLDLLNRELASGGGQSRIAEQAEQELKEFLDPDTITNYKFKTPSGLQCSLEGPIVTTNGNAKPAQMSGVSPFGNRILSQTNLAHRYPTPVNSGQFSPSRSPTTVQRTSVKPTPKEQDISRPIPSSSSSPFTVKAELQTSSQPALYNEPSRLPSFVDPSVLQKVPITSSIPRTTHNRASFSHNGTSTPETHPPNSFHLSGPTKRPAVSVKIPISTQPLLSSPLVPQHQINQESRHQPTVFIPSPVNANLTADFVTHGVPKSDDSRKRKRDDENSTELLTKDQRAEADEAVRQLHELIGDILEADDELRSDPTDSKSSAYHQFFVPLSYEGDSVKTLAPAVLTNLETALQKVISSNRLEEVPIEHLQRIQTLCMTAIAAAEVTDITVNEAISSHELEDLLEKSNTLEHGLRSARVVLSIVTGGRIEKELYPEELLQSIQRTLQKALSCVVPIVEARNSGPQKVLFETVLSQKKAFSQLLFNANKVLGYLVRLIGTAEMAEEIIIPLEFCAVGLLFVENAPSEKDSVLGILKFENLRRSAMDMITIIYSRYPEQRTSLFTEILSSLQKLPTGRQAKRHYKLIDGQSIQVVSALMMQLVQTIATSSPSPKKAKRLVMRQIDSDDSEGEAKNSIEEKESLSNGSEASSGADNSGDDSDFGQNIAIQRLSKISHKLCNSAATSASFAARYLVNRAQTSSKSGDEPHRQILDIFVEDLLTVLGSPEWPAAEILLRALFKSFTDIIDDTKSLAPAKNMALELLGMMGSAISDLVPNAQHAAQSLESQDSELSSWLREMVNDYTSGSLESDEIMAWNGPFHAVVSSLGTSRSGSTQDTSAYGYCLAQWAKMVCSSNMKGSKKVELAHRLRKGLLRTGSLPFDSQDSISPAQSHVAYALVILNMDFCRQFDYILKVLLRSINTETTTVRSRALRSVTQMLEKDPSLLDRSRDFKLLIGQCTTDGSSMVRDNALTLIAKCISVRPTLEAEFTPNVLSLANDPAVGVRKRTVKLLKDMYLRNASKGIKAKIGDCLLQRAQDIDHGVSEIARQTFEDIWIAPFVTIPELKDANAHDRIRMRDQVSLIVQTAQRSEEVRTVLQQLLAEMLAEGSKSAESNSRVCKSFVATSFEMILDTADNRLEQQQTLLTLTVFAQAKPKLFTADQVQILQPYIGNLSSTDDLDFFRAIVIIFRCVLPELSESQQELRRGIQNGLVASIQKLYKTELNEVAQCLWKLNSSLKNPEKLVNLMKSVLSKLHSMKTSQFTDPSQPDNLKRMKKYLWIAAAFGKHCDFEAYRDVLHKALPWWGTEDSPSVADLMVQSMKPFTHASHPLTLRIEALEGIGNICQAWPRQYTKSHISSAFAGILEGSEAELQRVVLESFRDFLHKIESQAASKPSDTSANVGVNNGIKLGATVTASESDGASTLIAQAFLPNLLEVALASQGDAALTAAQVISSINRQGLAHPRVSVSAIVALETSTNSHIADVALNGHKILHQQHESALEQEYMRSVREAFRYQRDVAHDSLGYTAQPIAAKLKGLWEVIRTSAGKYQKKFLSNFVNKINFDIAKLDLSGSPPNTLQFSRFLTENLAFFEYTRLDELLHTITCMENVVANTGSGLAHSISTEIFHITVEAKVEANEPPPIDGNTLGVLQDGVPPSSGLSEPPPDSQPKTVDPARLYILTTASIILSAVWEARTYLRRLYGQSSNQQRRENAKAKGAAKDLSKAPTRVQGVTGEKLVSTIAAMVAALNSEQGMMEQCQSFVNLMKLDDEVKVAEGSEEGSLDRLDTPDRDADGDRDTPMSGSSRGNKRKTSMSLSGTPSKRKRGRPPLKRSRSSRKSIDGDGDDDDDDWI